MIIQGKSIPRPVKCVTLFVGPIIGLLLMLLLSITHLYENSTEGTRFDKSLDIGTAVVNFVSLIVTSAILASIHR